MTDLAERLLDPQTVEAALDEIDDECVKDRSDAYGYVYDLADAIRELHKRAEQYRQNWLSLQNATGEDCHLRALEVVREIPELHRRLATAKLEGAAEEMEKYAYEVDEETKDEESFFHGVTTTEGLRERAAAIRKQMEGK